MIWHRVYESKEVVLALADEELMDREFEEDKFILKVGKFYRGELVDESDVEGLVRGAGIINAVGERSVGALISCGLATENGIKRVAGVPHVQVALQFL